MAGPRHRADVHPTTERFVERARDELGFDPAVREFDAGTETAAAAAAAVDCAVDRIVKSVVLVADGDPVVVLTAGDHRVDEAALAAALDADAVRVADAEEVSEATGWSIGGVPPVLHAADPETYVDPTLLEGGTLWAAAGTPSSMFPLSPSTLRELTGATPVDAFEDA
jgi:prolyl-tRNA editing enzyme YbaK/EbsC (Cys-tRNA(Pro) deacylase)